MPLQRNGIGGGVPLGGSIMVARDELDFTENGQRFIQSGYVDTDVTGIEDYLINHGTYFSAGDRVSLPTSWQPNSYPYVISDNGTHIFSNGTNCYRSTDNGSTWSSAITGVNTSSIKPRGLTTDGNGVWVSVGTQYIYSSGDDGLTWTQRINTSTNNIQGVTYDPITSRFYVIQKGASSGGTDSMMRWSDDGITWTVTNTGIGSAKQRLSLPDTGNTTLFIYGTRGSGAYYVFRSTDSGETWTLWLSDATGFIDKVIAAMWQMGDYLYVQYDAAPTTNDFTIAKYDINAAAYSSPLEVREYIDSTNSGSISSVPSVSHIDQLGIGGEYYSANGFKVLRDGFTIVPTWNTLNETSTSTSVQFYSNRSRMWREVEVIDSATTYPVLTNVPCVGNVTPYVEGQARQFVRIK